MNKLIRVTLLMVLIMTPFKILANGPATIEYFVVEVISSDTIYEPKARYNYTVRTLGNLSQLTNEPFPTTFSTDVVLKRETVGEGYWMLAKINRTTGKVYAIDVTKPEIGFSGSAYFKQIMLDRLKVLLLPTQRNITQGHRKANVKVNLGISDDLTIQSRYNKSKNNLALLVTDYYINQIVTDFSPFFARYAEINFEVIFADGIVVVRLIEHKRANHFLYKAIDNEEPLPQFLVSQISGKQ